MRKRRGLVVLTVALLLSAFAKWFLPVPDIYRRLVRHNKDPARRILMPSPVERGYAVYPPDEILRVLVPAPIIQPVSWAPSKILVSGGKETGEQAITRNQLLEQCKSQCAMTTTCHEIALIATTHSFRIFHPASKRCWVANEDGEVELASCLSSSESTSFRWRASSLQHVSSGQCLHGYERRVENGRAVQLSSECESGDQAMAVPRSSSILLSIDPFFCISHSILTNYINGDTASIRYNNSNTDHSHLFDYNYNFSTDTRTIPRYSEECSTEDRITFIPRCAVLDSKSPERSELQKHVLRAAAKTVSTSLKTETDKARSPIAKDRPKTRANHTGDAKHEAWLNITDPPRYVKNARPAMCTDTPWNFPPDWTASIVMCYHDILAETLRSSLFSILHHTTPRLLDQIIVVSEGPTPHREAVSAETMRAWNIPKVMVLDSNFSSLAFCRLQGARAVSGSAVLVFMDAHVEVMEGWLEPLLQATQIYGLTAGPVVESISIKDQKLHSIPPFSYSKENLNWALEAVNSRIPPYQRKPSHLPYMLPVVPEVFALSRTRWRESSYDSQLKSWGSERLEMSLREWMCGGQVYVIPCSRVGRVESGTTSKPDSLALREDNRRTATVWMDDFYRVLDKSSQLSANGTKVVERVSLRRRLKCKSFIWYLDHVNPQLRESLPSEWAHLVNSSRGTPHK